MSECVHHAQPGPCAANTVTANDCHTLVCPTFEANNLKIGAGAVFSHVLFKAVPALRSWDKPRLHAAAKPYLAHRIQSLTPHPAQRFCVLLI